MESALYIVATPIGNLGDITPRALDTLRCVDLVAAEDTRHSARLLRHFDIATPLVAYHDHSGERELDRICEKLGAGGSVALISDAGTPLISDPGYRLTRRAHESGYRVIPVPGACAAVAALSASGLPTDRFTFQGFLPPREIARRARLQQLENVSETLIFYEAPHRLLESVGDMVAVFGSQRQAVLGREITKAFETVRYGSLGQLQLFIDGDRNQQRGECVLVVSGAESVERELDEDTASLLRLLAQELPARKAAAIVAKHRGLKKNALYQYLLDQK